MSKPTYEYLEAQVKQLEADNEKAMSVLKEANDAVLLAKSKFEALAAENANARNAVQVFCDIVGANTDDICEVVGQDGVKAILAAMSATGNMPATDALLAEVRNEAGARAVELFAKTLGSPYSFRDEICYEDGFARAIEVVRDTQAPRFAAQLRKGAAQ
ncbi:ead/Ea22-like family protein [Citrobacter koseri]|nr:ead/Ea22-like family protein [Citrobacter koseri]WOI99629.1 ead/Ea22-like family protein [Citrobacter koseri]